MKTIKLLTTLITIFWAHSLAANGCDTYISSCQTLSTAGQTVCLSTDIQSSASSNCINISSFADNMTLDCKGFRVTRTASSWSYTGIYLNPGADGVTVRDCEANHWSAGLFSYGNDGWIEYNKFFDNNNGIYLYNTSSSSRRGSGNELAFNKLDDNRDHGIYVRGNTDDNYVHDNTVHGSWDHGIHCIRYSDGIEPDGNIFDENQVNLNGDSGIYLYDCDDGYVTNNTANRNGDHGLLLNIDSDGNVVDRNKFNRNGTDPGTWYGIYQSGDSSNTFSNNICKNNDTGPSNVADLCK
jgi:parallel beta-helix repeat protein